MKQMEEDHEATMREMDNELNEELMKRENLEKELEAVKEELLTIDERFPNTVKEMKESIEHAK